MCCGLTLRVRVHCIGFLGEALADGGVGVLFAECVGWWAGGCLLAFLVALAVRQSVLLRIMLLLILLLKAQDP